MMKVFAVVSLLALEACAVQVRKERTLRMGMGKSVGNRGGSSKGSQEPFSTPFGFGFPLATQGFLDIYEAIYGDEICLEYDAGFGPATTNQCINSLGGMSIGFVAGTTGGAGTEFACCPPVTAATLITAGCTTITITDPPPPPASLPACPQTGFSVLLNIATAMNPTTIYCCGNGLGTNAVPVPVPPPPPPPP